MWTMWYNQIRESLNVWIICAWLAQAVLFWWGIPFYHSWHRLLLRPPAKNLCPWSIRAAQLDMGNCGLFRCAVTTLNFFSFLFLFFWNQLGALAHRLRRRWDTGAGRRRTRVGCLSPSWTNQAPARSSNLAENSENSSPLYETSFIPGRLLNDATKPLVYSAAPTSGGTRPGG